jgi:hypothetical protein
MENIEKVLAGGKDDPILIGLASGEALNNAYLIAKGVRDVALSKGWGTDSIKIMQTLANFCSTLSSDECSRGVSFRTIKVGPDHIDIVIFANVAKSSAERLCELLNSVPPSPERAGEMGKILGYSEELVNRFVSRERQALSYAQEV